MKFQGLLAGGLYGIIDLSWNPDRYAVTTVQRGGKAVQVFSANQFSIISNACKGPMIWMALSGLSFSGVDCFLESVRMKKDHWNAVGGGMAAGIVMSSVHRRIDYMIATSLFCGLCMGVADFCGSTIFYDWERMDYVRDDSRRETFVESKAMADLKEKYKKYFVDENGREMS